MVMYVKTLYAKLHNVLVTGADKNYIGSVTVDGNWMDAAGVHENQMVDVLNVTNGNRLTTYFLRGRPGSGIVCLNGAAAHKFSVGDTAILISYCSLPLYEARKYKPNILLFNKPSYSLDDYGKIVFSPKYKTVNGQIVWENKIPSYTMKR